MTGQHPFHSLGPFVYCPLCSGTLEISEREELPRRYCPRCDQTYYHNPAPAAGGVIVQHGRVLLVKRKFKPRVGEWTLPAGFLEYFESPESCAVREIREETGIEARIDNVFGVYAGHDDPRHTAVLVLYRMTQTGGELHAGDDAEAADFFAASDVPEQVAFRAHKEALVDLYGEALAASWATPIRMARRAG
jgi:ADP-ribose pyrophosphatase YjhB (NUDIX family)